MYYKKVGIDEVVQKLGLNPKKSMMPIALETSIDKKLKTNLIIPPRYQAYSLAIEYMSKWFFSKRPKNFFQHSYLDASHVMDQFRKLKTRELIKMSKPMAHITVNEDIEFNRNSIDLYNLGATLYNNRARYNDYIYLDRDTNTRISMAMKQIKLNMEFSMIFDTKAMQDDVAASSEIYYRCGGSQKHFINIDFPIPKELIGQIAHDNYLCDKTGHYNVSDMLSHLNSRSEFPFVYKFNEATGNMEYFIRLPKCLVHILTSPIQKDSGNQYSMVMSDYTVRFSCEVRFLAINFFAYYSYIERENIHSLTQLDSKSFLFGITNLQNIPNKDEHGWQWDFRLIYDANSEEEQKAIKEGKTFEIDISSLGGNFRDVIEFTKYNALSPSGFINIKAFSFVSYIPTEIDWTTMKLKLLEPIKSSEIHLIFYIDKEYVNNTIIKNNEHYKNRMEFYRDKIGPDLELTTSLPNPK